MTRDENVVRTGTPLAARQPEPAESSAENAPLVVQYVDDESFSRSLERVATLHERLLVSSYPV